MAEETPLQRAARLAKAQEEAQVRNNHQSQSYKDMSYEDYIAQTSAPKKKVSTVGSKNGSKISASPSLPSQKNNETPFDINFDNFIKNIFTKAIIIKNYFVHIEELYKILNKDNSGLIKVTMGNFDRPVTKYLLVMDGKISYYQGNPLPTSSNIEADKKLKEILSK